MQFLPKTTLMGDIECAALCAGVLNSVCWFAWCVRVRRVQPYVWKVMVATMCLNVLILLEVFDFPPILWILDAHALWHAGTVPVSILWYR